MEEPTMYLVTIEVTHDADGYRAAVIDLGNDAARFVTSSYSAAETAVRAAQD